MKKTTIIAIVCAVILACALASLPFILKDAPSSGIENETEGESGSASVSESDCESSQSTPSESETDGERLNFGKTVRVLCWGDAERAEFTFSENASDTLEHAVYRRNQATEKALGVTLSFDPQNGGAAHVSPFVKKLENDVEGGKEYDLVAAYSRAAGQCVVKGLLEDLTETEYIDLSAPWYPERLSKDLSVGGSLYFVTGDVSVNALYGMYTIYYNREVAKRLGLCDPSALVKTGEWTLDKLFEMSLEAHECLNGGGVTDGYGFCTIYYGVDSFYTGAGLRLVEGDSAAKPLRLSSDYSGDGAKELSARLCGWLTSDCCLVLMQEGDFREPFVNGRALFCQDRFSLGEDRLADNGRVDFDYGILPVPLSHAGEQGYITCLASTFTLYGFARGCGADELTMLGAVVETLSRVGYEYTSPEIFKRGMGKSYSDGGADAEVFDLCRRTATSDLGRIYAAELENMSEAWSKCACKSGEWGDAVALRTTVLGLKLVELSSQIKENGKS